MDPRLAATLALKGCSLNLTILNFSTGQSSLANVQADWNTSLNVSSSLAGQKIREALQDDFYSNPISQDAPKLENFPLVKQ